MIASDLLGETTTEFEVVLRPELASAALDVTTSEPASSGGDSSDHRQYELRLAVTHDHRAGR